MDKNEPALSAFTSHAFTVVAVVFSLFHLYTAGTGPLTAFEQRVIHLGFGLIMVFLLRAPSREPSRLRTIANWIFCLCALAAGAYLYISAEDIAFRLGIANAQDIASGSVMVILLLEATRRVLGWPLPIIALCAILYGFFGNHLPGIFAHSGFDADRIISHLALTTEGVFSVPLGVSSTVVVIFIIFATFLNNTGVGQYFIDLVMSTFGRTKGGPAKAAVIGSAMMGTLTGSVVANVMGTGTFTIPLMKKAGYKPEVAGAVEACTSTGGQIMPPVMGAAAFIIAEFLQIPYLAVIKAALIPAILYYVALFVFVDLEAAHSGLSGLTPEEVQEYRERKKGKVYLLAPMVLLLILMIFLSWSETRSAFFAAMLTLAIGLFRRKDRLNLSGLITMFAQSGRSMLEVITACGSAGIVIGILSLTGMGLQLSSVLTALAGDNLMLLLLLTMVVSLILGMGLTTTACYVILAILVAPALIKMGVDPLAAHLFVFYYGMYSFITPPVAVGAYAASGIAKSSPMYTGFVAWKIALPGFILPSIFAFWPGLLLKGSWGQVLQVTVTAFFGVLFLSVAIAGYFKRELRLWERFLMTVAGAGLIHGGWETDVAGLGLGVGLMVVSFLRSRKMALHSNG
jgi:TRAP transporter 4TM/12TM fusion protein